MKKACNHKFKLLSLLNESLIFFLQKGLTYYYNVKTQKSQWNFPESETTANSKVIKTETSLVNTNTEISKVYKDQFRDKISKLVVNLLKPYLNEKCQAGRIKNTEDFKHLARKFTHTIIEKEMSRTSNLEELELDKRVKMKSAEYITNYMAKFNISGYSRKQDV
jgi:histone-lysine N-methyltransferase SETD2